MFWDETWERCGWPLEMPWTEMPLSAKMKLSFANKYLCIFDLFFPSSTPLRIVFKFHFKRAVLSWSMNLVLMETWVSRLNDRVLYRTPILGQAPSEQHFNLSLWVIKKKKKVDNSDKYFKIFFNLIRNLYFPSGSSPFPPYILPQRLEYIYIFQDCQSYLTFGKWRW